MLAYGRSDLPHDYGDVFPWVVAEIFRKIEGAVQLNLCQGR
jgi:hypothetical protein